MDKENLAPVDIATPSESVVEELAMKRKMSCEPSVVEDISEREDDDSLAEQLQQALDDKAELIEESIIDKERIKDQRETIELLTKRIREFEMSRSHPPPMLLPVRCRSSTGMLKQLGDDNIQMAKEMDRLIADRDRLERKLIDLKIRYANGYLTRQNSAASTDEDEELNLFSTLSIDEKLKKKGKPLRGNSSSGIFRWFKKSSKPNAVTRNVVV